MTRIAQFAIPRHPLFFKSGRDASFPGRNSLDTELAQVVVKVLVHQLCPLARGEPAEERVRMCGAPTFLISKKTMPLLLGISSFRRFTFDFRPAPHPCAPIRAPQHPCAPERLCAKLKVRPAKCESRLGRAHRYPLEDFPRVWERQKKSPLVRSQCAVGRVSLYRGKVIIDLRR